MIFAAINEMLSSSRAEICRVFVPITVKMNREVLIRSFKGKQGIFKKKAFLL